MLRKILGAVDQIRRYDRGELGYDCLFLNVATRCNSRCRYCEAHTLDASRELDQARLFTLFAEARDAGIGHVYLSGGEPLFRRDIWALIDKLLSVSLSREHFLEKFFSTIHPLVEGKSGSEARIST